VSRTRAIRGRAVAALLALAVVVGGCGLSANREPRVIAADDIPTELRDPSLSSSTTLAGSPATTAVTVYLLTQQAAVTRLVGVPREVKDSTRPRDHLAALLVPPTPAEQAQGLLTSIPADTVLIDTKLDDTTGELTIDLSRSLFDIQGQELRNAFAQLVWTATDVPGVRAVRFLVAGNEYRVPDENGIEQPGAVTRASYATLAPVPVTTTVPSTVPPTSPAPP
jgi:spore germination protein GerM